MYIQTLFSAYVTEPLLKPKANFQNIMSSSYGFL